MTFTKEKSLQLFTFASIIFFIEFFYLYSQSPDRMAVHFNVLNKPDGWMDKPIFLISFIIIYLITSFSTAGLGLLINKIPDDFINIPNKKKLLAPERRAETMSVVSNFLINTGSLTILLLAVINYFVFEFNIKSSGSLFPIVFPALGVYLISLVFMIISMFKFFKRVD